MRKAIVAVSAVAVAAAALGASGCASCSRAAKSISSDMGGGIDRTVFDDADGKRVVIQGGIVVCEEN